jgi:undecaprenyl-diphosphatase
MTTIEIMFLGIIQGLTEFLPVSSSGHLVLFRNLIGFKEPEILLDCVLHLGTLVAVCITFRSDLADMVRDAGRFVLHSLKGRLREALTVIGLSSTRERSQGSFIWWVFIGSIPTAFIGLWFKKPLESFFESVSMVGIMLVTTGCLLLITKVIPKAYESRREIGLLVALVIGISQGLAIIPGISRSGTTIAFGLLLGLRRDVAGRFSFLLAVPAILGATALQLVDKDLQSVAFSSLVFGFASAMFIGLLALKFLMFVVNKGNLYYFAPYCWAVGVLALVWSR